MKKNIDLNLIIKSELTNKKNTLMNIKRLKNVTKIYIDNIDRYLEYINFIVKFINLNPHITNF